MSTKISNMPSAPELYGNHLMIVEEVENGQSVETQKTTLQDLYEWLTNTLTNTYNIKTAQVQSQGNNLDRTVDMETNTVVFNFVLPNYTPKYYYEGEIVVSDNCIYRCINDNQSAILDDVNWARIGYNPGHYITIEDGNIISAAGVETWVSGQEYKIGNCVIYQKKLFQCLVANSDATWDKDKWQNIGEGNGILIYENGKTYDAGAIVIYDDVLYKRKTTGADVRWTLSNWTCISNGDYSVIYIKYSYDEPVTDSEMSDIPNRYIGIYNGSVTNIPQHYTDYSWYKIKGEDGTVNVEANSVVVQATLLASAWSSAAPYTLTINNNVFTADKYPIIDIVLSNNSADWDQEKEDFGCIDKAVCDNGSITFYCGAAKPEHNFTVKIRINGDVNEESFVSKSTFNTFVSQTQSAIAGLGTRVTANETDISGLEDSLQIIIDKLEEFDMIDYIYWLKLGNITNEYDSLAEVLASTDYPLLLENERSAAYAAYISSEIAEAIKADLSYLKQALLCSNSEMFFNSRFDFDEHIEDYTEENPKVNSTTYVGIVTCSSDRNSDPVHFPDIDDYGYYGYMAFDGSIDSNDMTVVYEDRHIWSAMGTNQWVQYKYSTPRNLYKVRIYNIRDNSPLSVEIFGSNDGENYTSIIEKNLNVAVGAQNYTEFNCTCSTKYMYYKFVFSDNYYSGSCATGEIVIYTFKEEE